ncbi:MAG: hypothetical protein WCL27_09435 [Betaproteobacteria bacterium]
MITRQYFRFTSVLSELGFLLMLVSCAQTPYIQHTPPPQIGSGYQETLDIFEPGPLEVVVVVNNNMKMVHAGMFAGDNLLDPAGSYEYSRRLESNWKGVSLQDYLRFQLDDGPNVKLYRFPMPVELFAQIKSRLENAGRTIPLFCAAKVQSIISGIEPFESVPDSWIVSPSSLAKHLDVIINTNPLSGDCVWPNGTSCYPLVLDGALNTTLK